MKLTIYDFFDTFREEASDQSAAQEPSAERIKVLTMAKIDNTKKIHRPMRAITRIAAVIAAVLMLSAGAYAARNWTGFASTGTMRQEEIQQMMDQIETSGCSEKIDADGTVHYYDGNGTEFMVLSPEEAVRFEKARREKQNQDAAQDLLDLRTLTVTPRAVTAVPTGEDATFGDFLLGNGSLVILHEEGETGYDLHAGDVVTITMDASDACIVEFGMALDGTLLEAETIKEQNFEKRFTIPEDGVYCFTLMYYSADCDNFTNGQIQID